MHRFAPVALATILAATPPAFLCAQAPTPFTVPAATGHFTDPANLAGERVRARSGSELPIDGGLAANGQPDNALGLAQLLRKLSTRASILNIVAHPDDEDGGMLTLNARGLGARVADLSLTRGEGGQNAMTGDFEDALGLLRTQELLANDRYTGVTQMFGTEVDFGFSKTKSEAFAKWNHQRVLYDVVRAIRIFRPLVITATFVGEPTDGHGQHQVSGEIAQEAFVAAGDPNVFPELTREGILPWQPLKMYARAPFSRVTAQGLYDYATGQYVPAQFTNYVTGKTSSTSPSTDITIHEGATDPLLTTCAANSSDLPPELKSTDCKPLSYVQFARIGLGLQRSQIGPGVRSARAGNFDAAYHLYGSRVCAPNLPNPTPNLCASHSTTAANHQQSGIGQETGNNHDSGWPTLSHSERVGYRAARDKRPSTSPTLVDFIPDAKAPTARSIPAQGNALGQGDKKDKSAEGAPYNPTLANQPSFFDGIDVSLEGLQGLAPKDAGVFKGENWKNFIAGISAAQRTFDPHEPGRCAPALADSLKALQNVLIELRDVRDFSPTHSGDDNLEHELRVKRAQLEQALALALNVEIEATTQAADAITRSTPRIQIDITSTPNQELRIYRPLPVTTTPKPGALIGEDYFCMPAGEPQPTGSATSQPFHSPINRSCTLPAHVTLQITRPYFYRDNIESPVYKLDRSDLRGVPQTPPALTASALFSYHDASFEVESVVSSSNQPVQIIPPVSLTLDRNAQVVPDRTRSLNIDVHTVTEDHPQGELRLHAPQDWTVRSPQRPLRAGTETFPASLSAHPQTTTLKAEATISGITYTEGFRSVGYGSLPRTNFYTPATLRIVPVDLKLPPANKRRIAYLPGTGDDVPAALASIGLTPTILKVSDLTPTNLSKFDTVVLGVRTYNAHPDLHGAPTQALFDFARNGGNVVVQTQTPEFTAADAPYPITDRNERVIDETAPVHLVSEDEEKLYPGIVNPVVPATWDLLVRPNKITPADFNNWIEERGHGFLDSWDPHYTALTETHDPGAPAEHILPQVPQRGGLITVQLGTGRWTYCAFALYRQLPEAVPGAFRLFVNLLNP